MFKVLSFALLMATQAAFVYSSDRQLSGQHFFQNCQNNGNGNGNNMEMELKITLRNIAYRQPMTPFFVVVHNEQAPFLFRAGYPASPELGDLAETGNVTGLVELYGATSTTTSTPSTTTSTTTASPTTTSPFKSGEPHLF